MLCLHKTAAPVLHCLLLTLRLRLACLWRRLNDYGNTPIKLAFAFGRVVCNRVRLAHVHSSDAGGLYVLNHQGVLYRIGPLL